MTSTSVSLKFLFSLHPRSLTPMPCLKIDASIMSSPCGWQHEEQCEGKLMWVVNRWEQPTETSQGNGSYQLETSLATPQDWNILNSNVVGRKQPECPVVTSSKERGHKLLLRVSFSYPIYLPFWTFLLLLLIKMHFVSYVICICNWRELSHWSS